MWSPESSRTRVIALSVVTALTLAFHYGWVVGPVLGHVHWVHAIHGRLCYIPIVIAAAWFGLRGGLLTASIISAFVLPYALRAADPHRFANDMTEIVFYFAIAVLTGVLVEREFTARRRQQAAQLHMERSQKLALVGQLAASVAHEIKNPLASIKGAADILTDDETSRGERDEFKDILQNEVKRIDATVAEFLEFARPRETRMETLDLTATVAGTLKQIEHHAREGGVSIDADLQEAVTVTGDEEKLHQMVLNVLLNAVQASQEGDTISVSLTDGNESHAELAIADSGAGIDESLINRIFEPFFTTRTCGSGLGLAVVKDVVDRHSGEIVVRSTVGRGTIVVVTLPHTQSGGAYEDSPGR